MPPDNRLLQPLGSALNAQLVELQGSGWEPVLSLWLQSPAAQALVRRIEARQAEGATVYPRAVWRAFALTPLRRVRAVVLGQDPYHGPGQAQGLAFSVGAGQRLPPSLRHIVQELVAEGITPQPATLQGDLSHWAQQGVLLLNTALTVEEGRAGAHARWGWSSLVAEVLLALQRSPEPVVSMLWGTHAQAHEAALVHGAGPRRVLKSNHPSPLSARRPPMPFLGCGHFTQARDFLLEHQPEREPIAW